MEEVSVTLTNKDYLNFLVFYYFRRNFAKKLTTILLATLLLAAIYIPWSAFNEKPYYLKALLIVVPVAILFVGIPFLISYVKFHKKIKKNRNFSAQQTYEFNNRNPNKPTITVLNSEGHKQTYQLASLKTIGESKDAFYMITELNKLYIIPKRYFSDRSFPQIVTDKINTEKKPKSAKHLYKWGFLGLIPIFGAFAGFYLLWQGIFNYKNIKLIIIGILPILFTGSIYGYLYHQSKNIQLGMEHFVPYTQVQLNLLNAEILKYHEKNGVFPQSLNNLVLSNPHIKIRDTLQAINSKNMSPNFNYEVTANAYVLFSSGPDKKKNTSDDIYPQ